MNKEIKDTLDLLIAHYITRQDEKSRSDLTTFVFLYGSYCGAIGKADAIAGNVLHSEEEYREEMAQFYQRLIKMGRSDA